MNEFWQKHLDYAGLAYRLAAMSAIPLAISLGLLVFLPRGQDIAMIGVAIPFAAFFLAGLLFAAGHIRQKTGVSKAIARKRVLLPAALALVPVLGALALVYVAVGVGRGDRSRRPASVLLVYLALAQLAGASLGYRRWSQPAPQQPAVSPVVPPLDRSLPAEAEPVDRPE